MASNAKNGEAVRRILLAEDNPHDKLLLEESFHEQNLHVEIEAVADGDQLIALLRQGERVAGRYGLIVLDSHLPKRTAEEVLATLQEESIAPGVPIVILSSMVAESQKRKFLELGVAKVLSKPLDLDEYIHLAGELHAMIAQ